MPRVPVDQNQVGISEVNGTKFRAPDLSGTGGEALGRGLQRIGAAVADYAEGQDQIQDHADKISARNEGLMFRKQVNSVLGEYKALQGKDATDQGAAFQAKLGELQKQYLERAGNPRMRRYLEELVAPSLIDAQDSIADHSRTELFGYTKGTYESGVALAQQSAAQFYGDPKQYGAAMAEGRDYLTKLAKLEGWDENTTRAKELEFTTGVHSAVIGDMLEQVDPDLDAVQSYLSKHESEMTVAARRSVLADLQDPLQRRQADADFMMATGGGIVAKATAPSTVSSRETMYAITVQSESGGNPNAVSPVGARGLMQVMPGTSRDPGFGIRPSNGTPADDVRVGREYLDKMMQRYGNDPAKAWAAYNWGPGNLDKAMAKHGANWLANAPKETRDYVAKNMAQLGTGVSTEAPREWDKDATYNKIDAVAAKEGWTPERIERAKRRADQIISRDEDLLNRERRKAGDEATLLVTNLGDGFTSINQIPAAVRARMDPLDVARFNEAARKNADARAAIPKNSPRSLELQILQRTDPDAFAKLNLAQEVGKVAPDELQGFVLKQAELVGQANKPKAYDPRSGINSAIEWGKKYGGVDVSDSDFPKVYDAMDAYLQGVQAKKGTLDRADYDAAFKAAMRDIPTSGMFGLYRGSMKVYEVDTVDEIPSGRRAEIDRSFRAANGRDPTDGERLTMYRRMLVNPVRR